MNDKKRKDPTKITLVIRILVAVYLLYLAWDLRVAPAAYEGGQKIFFIIMIAVFGAVGLVIGGFSAKALIKGEYDDSDDE